jgi:hypothetical protein
MMTQLVSVLLYGVVLAAAAWLYIGTRADFVSGSWTATLGLSPRSRSSCRHAMAIVAFGLDGVFVFRFELAAHY